jgi:hypothetical protein
MPHIPPPLLVSNVDSPEHQQESEVHLKMQAYHNEQYHPCKFSGALYLFCSLVRTPDAGTATTAVTEDPEG